MTPEEAREHTVRQLESLGRLRETGLMLLVYVNTDRHCAKEVVRV